MFFSWSVRSAAEILREIEFPGLGIDGDDLARAGNSRALERRESDAATTDDDDTGARRNMDRVERGAEAGRDTATDERGAIKRHVLSNLHERSFGTEHLLGKRREVGEL